MSLELRNRLYAELSELTLIDPHTHINPHQPASRNLADILGYHYYTELAHSAGMPREEIEADGLEPREKVRRLMQNLGPLDNTIQYSWLVEMAHEFFGFSGDRILPEDWEDFYDSAEQLMSASDWAEQVLRRSKLEAVFLTNDFDDRLEGFDTSVYIPCLRTDDLVFHLAKSSVRERLELASETSINSAASLRRALRRLFVHFRRNNAKACAISLPPDFSPTRVSDARANAAVEALWRSGEEANEAHRRAAAHWVFWTLAELCDEFRLPFDLMIGVNRQVYPGGVYQGMDLYDSRVSLIQYRELFNAFPQVTFPVSVLASVTNQELTSYAWIFPNVVTNGHWWYSNTPTFIEHDAAARLEAVPRTKQIGYYSDMYKLEFALPKFNMYKRILAKILAERYVIDRGWSEERAIELGRQVLRTNVEEIFRWGEAPPEFPEEPAEPTPPAEIKDVTPWALPVAAAATAASTTPEPTWQEPVPATEFTYWPRTSSEDADDIKLVDDESPSSGSADAAASEPSAQAPSPEAPPSPPTEFEPAEFEASDEAEVEIALDDLGLGDVQAEDLQLDDIQGEESDLADISLDDIEVEEAEPAELDMEDLALEPPSPPAPPENTEDDLLADVSAPPAEWGTSADEEPAGFPRFAELEDEPEVVEEPQLTSGDAADTEDSLRLDTPDEETTSEDDFFTFKDEERRD